jgi:hypothetical protein
MFDVRFKVPSSFILAGATMTGKTMWTMNFLRQLENLVECPGCAANVVYFYKDWQPSFESFSKEGIVREWVNRLPTSEDILEQTEGFHETGSVIVIDDFQQKLNKDTIEIFTSLAHRTNSIVILLVQNIFCGNRVFREMSLNATYIVLFRNPRDGSQINCFAKQIAPGNVKWLVNKFHEVTKLPHSYMLFDCHQKTPHKLKFRSRVLPHEFPIQVHASDE